MLPTHRQLLHPGEILLEEFLHPLGITQAMLAEHLDIVETEVEGIVKENQNITPNMAWLLAQSFQTSPEFWMNLQAQYDLCLCRPTETKSSLIVNNSVLAN